MTDIVSPIPIDLLPLGPRPTDTPEQFDDKSFATLEAQEAMIPQINAAAISVNQNAIAAQERAQAAEQSNVAAGESERAALGHMQGAGAERQGAEQAQASAWAAAAAAGDAAGLPALAGNAGKVLMVNQNEQGVSFQPGVPARGQQLFTASQNISKSMFGDATYVFVELWGAGGSGAANNRNAAGFSASGGEGGAYDLALLRVEDLPGETPLVIGAGGVAVSAAQSSTGAGSRNGNPGGNSSFGSFLEVAGGLGGNASASGVSATGPSRLFKSGVRGKEVGGPGGGHYVNGAAGIRGDAGPGGSTALSGPGGGAADAYSAAWSVGGKSLTGAEGGFGVMRTNNSVDPVNAGGGAAPGGGGGAITWSSATTGSTITSGAGARGQAKLTWW